MLLGGGEGEGSEGKREKERENEERRNKMTTTTMEEEVGSWGDLARKAREEDDSAVIREKSELSSVLEGQVMEGGAEDLSDDDDDDDDDEEWGFRRRLDHAEKHLLHQEDRKRRGGQDGS